jgi:exopolysaccharide biosynthesis protein
VADGRNKGYSSGVTMSKFTQISKTWAVRRLQHDGGGSSEMVFMGEIVNTPCNKNGAERGTSDILYIAS